MPKAMTCWSWSAAAAALGLLPQQESYPDGLMALVVGPSQRTVGVRGARAPTGQRHRRSAAQLARHRQVRLSAEVDQPHIVTGLAWTATDYLMVMEMAEDGIGWAELPRALVQRYDRGRLVELTLPGWPRRIHSDLLWRRDAPPGPTALWWADALVI